MDNIDQELLALLTKNGRESVANLAAYLGITRATVNARIAKLKARGIILGYTTLISDQYRNNPIVGMMMIKVSGHGTDNIKRRILRLMHIESLHNTNGQWDIIVRISAPDIGQFDEVLSEIRRLDGIASSETHLLLSTERYLD